MPNVLYIPPAALRKLLVEMDLSPDPGYPMAGGWDEERLQKKLNRLPEIVQAYPNCRNGMSGESQEWLRDILDAGPGARVLEQADAPPPNGQPAFKRPRPPRPEGGAMKKVGIISTIVEMLGAGTKKNPIAKGEILSVLTKKFPERDPEGMKVTINAQVPTRLRTNGVDVRREGNGYYIEPPPPPPGGKKGKKKAPAKAKK